MLRIAIYHIKIIKVNQKLNYLFKIKEYIKIKNLINKKIQVLK